jgi:hypothetical protein
MNITKAQIQKIHGLLPAHIKSDKELKESIIIEYTQDFSKYSTKDLTFEQANALIVDLGGKPVYNEWAGFNYKKDSHRYILSLLQHAGWVRYDKQLKRHVADMNRFGQWLQGDNSPVKKPLNKQEKEEISKTIVALEGILEFELKTKKR